MQVSNYTENGEEIGILGCVHVISSYMTVLMYIFSQTSMNPSAFEKPFVQAPKPQELFLRFQYKTVNETLSKMV